MGSPSEATKFVTCRELGTNKTTNIEIRNMKTTFGDNQTEKTIDLPKQAVVTDVATTLAVPDTQTSLALPTQEIQGDFKNTDINLPVLQIVQGVGPMKVKFPQNEGSFVLNKELLLTAPSIPLQFVVTRFRKQIIENLPYGEDSVGQARVVDSEEDAIKLGGVMTWEEDEKGKRIPPTWVPIGTAFCVLLAPKGLEEDPAFPYEYNGKRHAIAIWRLRSTAYTTVAKSIVTASQFSLTPENGGLAAGLWSAITKYEKRGLNFVHVPYISQIKERNTPEFKAFCQKITSL